MRYDVDAERFYLARMYSEAVRAAGGLPIHIPLIPEQTYLQTLVRRMDGVLLPGSASDVDPLRYGCEPRKELGVVHTLRDETDQLVLQAVEEHGTPLLAICYGLQALNVKRGGTLIQDIASEEPAAIKHEQGAPRDRRSHNVRLAVDSKLARYATATELLVNSHHHQAIKSLGEGLRAVAWTSDGLIEAVEDTDVEKWITGVQWHPEIAWAEDDFSRKLFAEFVAAANHFAASKSEHRQNEEQQALLSVR